jgi:hypothetical protein
MSRSLCCLLTVSAIVMGSAIGCDSSPETSPAADTTQKRPEPPQKVGGKLKGENRPARGFKVPE